MFTPFLKGLSGLCIDKKWCDSAIFFQFAALEIVLVDKIQKEMRFHESSNQHQYRRRRLL